MKGGNVLHTHTNTQWKNKVIQECVIKETVMHIIGNKMSISFSFFI